MLRSFWPQGYRNVRPDEVRPFCPRFGAALARLQKELGRAAAKAGPV